MMKISSHSDCSMDMYFCVYERACKTILRARKSVHANIAFFEPYFLFPGLFYKRFSISDGMFRGT